MVAPCPALPCPQQQPPRMRAAGGCLVRAAHTGLSWGVTLLLFLYPTDLRKQEERGESLQPLLFVASVLCSVLLYFAVSLMDPGYVEGDGGSEDAVAEMQKAVPLQQDPAVRLRRCGHCLLKQPMRAKHCQACRHCVRRYDHHCPWIENCVGERNHPLFILYLVVQLVVLVWALPVAWSGLHFEQISWVWLQHNLLLLLAFLVILVFTFVVALLLPSHLYLISCNTTTWEFISRHRISYLRECKVENPFDQGVLLNLWKFFCACHLVAWENLYSEGDSEPV